MTILPWRSLPPRQRWWLAVLALAVIVAQIRQPFPDMAPLQHLPTMAMLLIAPGLLRRWPMSDGAVGCVVAFLLLHTLAGRYVYSYVPYDAWARALTGVAPGAALGWTRNHFDRLVHFCFGALAMSPVREAMIRHAGAGRRLALGVAIGFVLALSCAYEIFEWLLTILIAGPAANAYNGQQGDIWDAQKDMALAGVGAAIGAILLLARSGKRDASDG